MRNKKLIGLLALVMLAVLAIAVESFALDSSSPYHASKWTRYLDVTMYSIFPDYASVNSKEYTWRKFGSNCFYFARLVTKQLTGVDFSLQIEGKRAIRTNAQEISRHRNEVSGVPSTQDVKNAFQNVSPGDVIQLVGWSWHGEHTMVIAAVYNDGFETLEGNNPENSIVNGSWTYSYFASTIAAAGTSGVYYKGSTDDWRSAGGFTIYHFGDPIYIPDTGEQYDSKPSINRGLLSLNKNSYAKVYTHSSERYSSIYSDSELTSRLDNWIDEDEECRIIGVGWNSKNVPYARILFPRSNGSFKEGYVSLSAFIPSIPNMATGNAREAVGETQGLYRRADWSTINNTAIRKGNAVYLLTPLVENPNEDQLQNLHCQVMYPSADGKNWIIAWTSQEVYNSLFVGGVPKITGPTSYSAAVAGVYYDDFQAAASTTVTKWRTSAASVTGYPEYYRSGLPSGMSINTSTGKISGTPAHTSDGKGSYYELRYRIYVQASNSNGTSSPRMYTLYVWEPPVITTSSTLSSATVNSSYSQTIRADGTEKTMKWKLIGSLPPGLTFTGNNNKRTATISGKPTQAGTYSFKIQCSNFEHLPVTTTVKEFTITVKGRDPWLDSNLKLVYIFRNGKVGQYYSDWVRTDVKTFSSYSYSGNLPDGLKLTCSGKQIYLKGTPTKAGTYTFRIYVFGNDGGYNYKDFTVTITGQSTPFEDTSMSISWLLVSGKQYIYYNDYVQVNGGSSAYTPSIVSGALPSGLSLVQSGAKTYVRGSSSRTGTFYFRLRVTGSHGGYAEKDLSITLKPSSSYMAGAPEDGSAKKPKISSTKLNNATVDQEWSHTLEAYGTQPITWLAEGEWPEGFEIDSQTGTITGIPTEVGKLRFKVKAENEIGYTIKTLKLKVVGERPSIETQGLPDGFVGVSYDVQLEASGTDPLRWKKSGSLPSGLKLNTKEGRIYGTPKRAGVYDFTLRVKNKAGTTERSDFRITILAEEPTKEDEATTEQNNNTTSSSAPTVETTQDNTRNSGGAWPEYTDLFMLSDDKKLSGAVTRTSEGALKFAVDQWVDESGNAVKVSDVKIFLNDNELEGVEISDEGVFTLSEDLLATLSKDFTIYALANAGGLEIKTNEVNVTSSAYDEEHGTSGGGCSTGLAGLSLLALLGFATEKRKR